MAIYTHTAIGTSASAVEYEGLDPTEHEWINASTNADVDTIHRLLMVDPTLVNRKVLVTMDTIHIFLLSSLIVGFLHGE